MYIYPLSRIHNRSSEVQYFGLDNRECECVKYLFINFTDMLTNKTDKFRTRSTCSRRSDSIRQEHTSVDDSVCVHPSHSLVDVFKGD
jgi:hypothetical protein